VTHAAPKFQVDPSAFRSALGKFATGVALVSTRTDAGPMGIMVNSFASVSLDPPLVLWSIDKNSKRRPSFEVAQETAIHILAADQHADCIGFTKDAQAFGGLTLADNANGPPLVEGCLARFECSAFVTQDAGDHIILIARVDQLTTRDADPLVFFEGAFGSLPTAHNSDDQT
jgi:flavin reductase (DIM6/NTAB) family NADH-FMN oxidoreductase RutF